MKPITVKLGERVVAAAEQRAAVANVPLSVYFRSLIEKEVGVSEPALSPYFARATAREVKRNAKAGAAARREKRQKPI